ncbi:nucleic acid/nucleotide deaminase domain-containing protein [Nonomuraea angiospora]
MTAGPGAPAPPFGITFEELKKTREGQDKLRKWRTKSKGQSPEEKFTAEIKELVRKAGAAQLDAWKKGLEQDDLEVTLAKRGRRPWLLKEPSDTRRQAGLAWLLTLADPKRVCVAVLYEPAGDGKSGTMYLAANTASEGLAKNAKEILEVRNEDDVNRLTKDLQDTYRNGLSKEEFDKRHPKNFKETVTRRVRNVSTHLRTLPNVEFTELDDSGIPGQHCEMRLVDNLSQRVGRKLTNEVSLGISKLCCAKCYLALQAVKITSGMTVRVQGAHLNSYPNWPLPRFLADPDVMKEFLGPAAYALYQEHPEPAQARIRALSSIEDVNLEYGSSGEED